MHKGKMYVTEDYYGGIRLSAVSTDATNIDGSSSIFENTGRGSGDIGLNTATELVRRWNAFEEGGSYFELLTVLKELVNYTNESPNHSIEKGCQCLLCKAEAAIASAEQKGTHDHCRNKERGRSGYSRI